MPRSSNPAGSKANRNANAARYRLREAIVAENSSRRTNVQRKVLGGSAAAALSDRRAVKKFNARSVKYHGHRKPFVHVTVRPANMGRRQRRDSHGRFA